MIKRVKIKGFKSLIDFEMDLKTFSLIIGPNGAGKSNFLDALQLLSRIVTSRTLKEAFELPYRSKPFESFTFGQEGIKSLMAKERAAFSIEVDVELSPVIIDRVNRRIFEIKKTQKKDGSYIHEKFLRYRIEIEIRPQSNGIVLVSDEYLTALTRKGVPKSSRNPFLETIHEKIHLRMEGHAHPIYYERCLDYSILSRSLYPPHYPHITAMQQEISDWFFYYFEPRERRSAPGSVKEARRIGLMGEELASFLNTIKSMENEQFIELEKILHSIVPSISGLKVEVNNLGEVELKVIEYGTHIPAGVLSEGTLRILRMLAALCVKETPAVVCFEEPENGLHPQCIKFIAELLQNHAEKGSTQLIVTSHSPLFSEMIQDENIYVCRKIKGKTKIKPLSLWGSLEKRNVIEKALNY